ncbi:hypothetical protein [Ilumatobacter sp.]|uniref:hypothetical protein n=1 Tax=Ilumatobacter sp. TaxID=1967498 RepID=UPI003C6F30B1
MEDGPLGDVCPQRIVIQTAMLPGPDVGPLFELLGPDPQIDGASATVSGGLVRVDGTEEDVVLEIRSGGPAVGFRSPLELLTTDPEILLAQTSAAVAMRDASTFPSVGVVTLTDRSRDVIIVDPQSHPDVDSIDGVRDAGIEVRHVTDSPFTTFLEGTGALSADQLVAGFDGEPAAFVQSGGSIAQQGDQLVEPVLIPSLPQWGRPVVAIDAESAGWVDHDDSLAVRTDDVDDQRECLERLVPVIQEATVAYVAAPELSNDLMSFARAGFAPLSRLTADLMDEGVSLGVSTGVFGDGADSTVGNFDIARLEPFFAEFADVLGIEPVPAADVVTNEFIDPSVTLEG